MIAELSRRRRWECEKSIHMIIAGHQTHLKFNTYAYLGIIAMAECKLHNIPYTTVASFIMRRHVLLLPNLSLIEQNL